MVNPVESAKGSLVLMGLKHSGKTVQGLRLSRLRGMPFRDLDEAVAEGIRRDHPELDIPSGISQGHVRSMALVRAFYRSHGADAFRLREARALKDLLSPGKGSLVLSLGGGAMENTGLMSQKSARDTWIFLDVPEDILFARIMQGGIPPFLDPADPKGSFHILYGRRRDLARNNADITVELGDRDVDASGTLIESALKEHDNGR